VCVVQWRKWCRLHDNNIYKTETKIDTNISTIVFIFIYVLHVSTFSRSSSGQSQKYRSKFLNYKNKYWYVSICYCFEECVNRRSSETSVHTRSTRRHIPEDGILHSHRHENLKSYILFLALFCRHHCCVDGPIYAILI
jgi:hypothetical protein